MKRRAAPLPSPDAAYNDTIADHIVLTESNDPAGCRPALGWLNGRCMLMLVYWYGASRKLMGALRTKSE